MTLTVLASVSLFALISSARPLRRVEDDLVGYRQPMRYSDAVKTILESGAQDIKAIRDCLECHDDVRVHLSSVDDVQEYLSAFDEDSVKAVVQVEEENFHSPDEKELLDVLQRMESERGRHTPVSDDQIDKLIALSMQPSASEDPMQEQGLETSSNDSISTDGPLKTGHSTSVIVIAASCIAAFLALACVGAALYIMTILKRNVLTSHLAWDMLPALEKLNTTHEQSDLRGGRHALLIDVSDSDAVPLSKENIKWDSELLVPRPLHKTTSQTSIGTEKSEQDLDEKFYDIESSGSPSPYSTPALPIAQLPFEETEKGDESWEVNYLEPEMQEVDSFPGGFSPRPSWSVRAAEAKLRKVGSNGTDSRTGSSYERRAYGGATQFDAALAMQLRPGLGVGADAAWLVRFVMALFGWCAVLVSGRHD